MPQDLLAERRANLLTRVWNDPTFRDRLLASPPEVLAEAGIAVPAGMEVCVVEDTDSVKHLVLPPLAGSAV